MGERAQSLGDFKILREIARGGMGVVYEAEQISLGRRVAVKILPFAGMLDKRQLARFQNEARAAATLFHPHIVPVFFVGSDRGVNFYAMQLIEGQSLAEVIAAVRKEVRGQRPEVRTEGTGIRERVSVGPALPAGTDAKSPSGQQPPPPKFQVPSSQSEICNLKSAIETQPIAALSTEYSSAPARFARRVAELGRQVAAALDHAHAHGIIHRDVKPGNILLDEGGKPWITDFGLARLDSSGSITRSDDLLGTLRYMSPEGAAGGSRGVVDQRTDIYSLGATLYELLTLRPAFTGNNRQELLRRIAIEEPLPPQKLQPAIPADLETVVLKAMAKDPAERYETARELADDLGRVLQSEPVQARRAGPCQRVGRWLHRHRRWFAGAVLLALLAMITLSVATLLLWRERDRSQVALATAEQQRNLARTQTAQVQQQRDLAEINLRQARKAVDTYFTLVSESTLLDEPGLQPLRKQLLESALDYYEQFAAQRSDDPRLRAELAASYLRVAQIYYLLDEYDASLAHLERALPLLQELLQDSTAADGLKEIGPVFIGGRVFHYSARPPSDPRQAQTILERTVRVWEQLVRRHPGRSALRNDLAGFFLYLGDLYDAFGKNPEAVRAFGRARELWQALSHEEPDVLEHRANLANSCEYLAKVLPSVGRAVETADVLRKAYRIRIELVAEAPQSPEYRHELAGVCGRLARLGQTSVDEADRLYRRAYEILRDLSEEYPRVPSYRETLAISLAGRGTAARFAGRKDEAERHYAEALTTIEQLAAEYPDRFQYRERLAGMAEDVGLHLWRMGRQSKGKGAYARAIELRMDLLAHYPHQPGRLAQVAWLMVVWPDPLWADPERSLELAEEAVRRQPGAVNLWRVLAAAHYRAGDWEAALDYLNQWLEKGEPGRGRCAGWFFLAMAHEQLGNHDQARHWYSKAVAWMDEHNPRDERLRHLRSEAETVINDREPTNADGRRSIR